MDRKNENKSMIILKGAGRPGQLRPDFLSKMDFHRPPVSQNFSNDKDKILQDVSSLPFYPKIHSVDSLFRIPTFFFWPTFCPKTQKPQKRVFSKKKKKKKKKTPQADPLTLVNNLCFTIFLNFFSVQNGPPEAEIREISSN